MKKTTTLGLLLAATVLAGCNTTVNPFDSSKAETATSHWDSASAQRVDSILSDAALKATQATTTLAQVERAKTAPDEPLVNEMDLEKYSTELLRPTSVKWQDKAEDLVAQLANSIGYKFQPMGKRPPVDIIVTVTAEDEPLIHIFNNIQNQIGKYAKIKIYQDVKRVELRYGSPNDGVFNDNAAPTFNAPATTKAPAFGAPKTNNAPTIRRQNSDLGK